MKVVFERSFYKVVLLLYLPHKSGIFQQNPDDLLHARTGASVHSSAYLTVD